MATTTNFGWETPDDTDLVKDGALAIRTLGNSIDTSLVDLKGGTTGQVLSKTSNTDMDFTWVTSDDANAIQNAIVDAKGDLIAASAADTPARLAVGNNGETLVADSSTSTGLRWQTAANGNFILNGAQEIWQRGTSFATAGATYTSDRWQGSRSGVAGMTVSRQATNDTTNLPFIQYCARIQRDSGNTNTSILYYATTLESEDSRLLQGQTVVLSFYARAGANYSSGTNVLTANITSGTGTNQNIFTGFTSQTTVVQSAVTLTTTWQRFSITGTVSSSATQLATYFYFTPSGTAGASDFFEITGMQLERGSVPTAFKRAGNTLAGELLACKRYLPSVLVGSGNTLTGYATATTNSYVGAQFDVQARVAPTGLTVSGTSYTLYAGGGGSGTPTAIAFDSAGVNSALIQVTTTAASPTLAANNAVALRSTAAASQILFTGCEL